MRLFAFIKPNIVLFGETAWAQVMYNGFTIIFPLTHTALVEGLGWVVTNGDGNSLLICFSYMILGFLLVLYNHSPKLRVMFRNI